MEKFIFVQIILIVTWAVTGIVSACDVGQYECVDGTCIPANWLCDTEYDCPNADDEENCDKGCASDMFECAISKACIRQSWTCDGDVDCGQGDTSDEENCVRPTCSPVTEITCPDGKCLPLKWKCDGQRDCPDGFDEESCPPRACPDTKFRCDDGMCIDIGYKCDDEPDCAGGEDESVIHCPEKETKCQPNEFACRIAGTCINIGWVCDGELDCDYGSDEENCTTTHSPHHTTTTITTVRPTPSATTVTTRQVQTNQTVGLTRQTSTTQRNEMTTEEYTATNKTTTTRNNDQPTTNNWSTEKSRTSTTKRPTSILTSTFLPPTSQKILKDSTQTTKHFDSIDKISRQTTPKHTAETTTRSDTPHHSPREFPTDTVIIVAAFVPGLIILTTLFLTLYCCCWKNRTQEKHKNGKVTWSNEKDHMATIDILEVEEENADVDEQTDSGVYTGPKMNGGSPIDDVTVNDEKTDSS